MAMNEHEIRELKSLWAEDWELMFCTDGAEFFGAVSRTDVGLRFGEGVDCTLPYSGLDELLDAQTMCRRIEEESGLGLAPKDWNDLLYSMVANDFAPG